MRKTSIIAAATATLLSLNTANPTITAAKTIKTEEQSEQNNTPPQTIVDIRNELFQASDAIVTKAMQENPTCQNNEALRAIQTISPPESINSWLNSDNNEWIITSMWLLNGDKETECVSSIKNTLDREFTTEGINGLTMCLSRYSEILYSKEIVEDIEKYCPKDYNRCTYTQVSISCFAKEREEAPLIVSQ